MIELKTGSFEINKEGNVVLEGGVELNMGKEDFLCLKYLQSQALEILLVVDKFCEENKLTYYLGEGTLLGAIRHQGFIPWDDDIDILMPREDYEKFLELGAKDLPEGFELDSSETNPNHWTILSQVQMTQPSPYIKKRMEGIALNNGPAIDIFPIDYVSSDSSRALAIRSRRIRALRRAMWIKSGVHNRDWYKTIFRRLKYYYPLKLFGKFKTLKQLRDQSHALMTKTNSDSDSAYAIIFSSLYSPDRETFRREYFGEPIKALFEGYMLPVPREYEKVLSIIYGDYMELPPVKNRKTKHYYSFEPESITKIKDKDVIEFVEYIKEMRAQTEEELLEKGEG